MKHNIHGTKRNIIIFRREGKKGVRNGEDYLAVAITLASLRRIVLCEARRKCDCSSISGKEEKKKETTHAVSNIIMLSILKIDASSLG